MITRYALFEGRVHDGRTAAFRTAVLAELLPVWQSFPGTLAIRVTFGDSRDEGAPEFPLILAIDWPDTATLDAFLAHPVRQTGRAATEHLLSRFFTGRIHHHVTTAHA
ncbi:MAG: hypothetical protein ACT4OK_09725 [Gemmobacter sp.]